MKKEYSNRQRKIYSDYSLFTDEKLLDIINNKGKYLDEVIMVVWDIINERKGTLDQFKPEGKPKDNTTLSETGTNVVGEIDVPVKEEVKWIMAEEFVSIFSLPDPNSEVLANYDYGHEVNLGKNLKKNGSRWFEVKLSDGKTGYVQIQKVKIFIKYQKSVLSQDYIDVYESPDSNSNPKFRLKKGAMFIGEDIILKDGKQWLKVRHNNNMTGYIPGSTRVKQDVRMFQEDDYISYLLGVVLLGGLVITPIVLMIFAKSSYLESLPFSLIYNVAYSFFYKRDGRFTNWGIVAVLIALFVSFAYNYSTGKPSFHLGIIIGLISVGLSGIIGVNLGRLIRRKRK